MARPRTPIGTFGDIPVGDGKVKARVRYRDHDGQLRLVQATGPFRRGAERAFKEKLASRDSYVSGTGELTPDSTFKQLVEVWLEDLDLEGKLAPSTRALYERNMRQLVMPAFENFLLREISVRKVDQLSVAMESPRWWPVEVSGGGQLKVPTPCSSCRVTP